MMIKRINGNCWPRFVVIGGRISIDEYDALRDGQPMDIDDITADDLIVRGFCVETTILPEKASEGNGV